MTIEFYFQKSQDFRLFEAVALDSLINYPHMYKLFAFLLAFSVSVFSAHGQSQAEMNAVALQEFQKAEVDLQKQCKKLIELNDNDPSFVKLLEATQKSWLAYVDSHVQSVFPLAEGESVREVYGTSYPMELALLKSKLYKQRIDLLASESSSVEQATPNASSNQELYKVIEVEFERKNVKQFEQALNKLSSEGWRLKIHVVGNSYIFTKTSVGK